MTWNFFSPDNSVPATHVKPTEDRYARFYYDNESVVLSWTQGTEAATWKLRNYYGDIVSTGTVSGTSVNLGVLPLGWYKIYFSSSNPSDTTPVWGPARGEITFAVARSSGPLRNTPIPSNETFAYATSAHATHALTGMAPYRLDIDLDSVHPGGFATSLQQAKDEIALAQNYDITDSARPRPMIVQFPEGTGGMTPSGTDVSQITQTVTELSALGVTYFEARNEPNTGAYTAANYVTELQAFYNTVKAANASAKVVGGCSVSLTDSTYIDGILAAGAGAYMDVMSVHTYNGTNGNLAAGRESWDRFTSILSSRSFSKPVWMSEYGQFAYVYGSFEPRLQTQWLMLDMHLAEQHGVSREKYMTYYDVNVGFWDYPSFLWTNDYGIRMPTALPAVMRVWSEETFGKTYAARLNFGTDDNEWIGSRFTGSDGSSVVCLQSGGGTGTVSFDVTGASSLSVVSTFGAISTVPVVGGKVQVTLDVEPCYVRLPTGATLTPTALNYGIEVIRAQFAVPSASSLDGTGGTTDVVVDGRYSNGAYTIGPKVYRGSSSDNGPGAWFRVDFPKVTRLDRVTVYCPHPWQNDTTLLDFDVQYLDVDNTTWLTAATYTDTSAADLTFKWASHAVAGACFTDSYWNRRHIFRFSLPAAVQTKAIRLYVRDMSAGGGAVPGVNTGFGSLDSTGAAVNNGQTGVKRISLMEITAYLSTASDGGTATAGQPLVALKGI